MYFTGTYCNDRNILYCNTYSNHKTYFFRPYVLYALQYNMYRVSHKKGALVFQLFIQAV